MRPGQQNKRSRGRNNRKNVNPLTRNYESNGPDVKVRGNAAHIADKYVQLARDAAASGDSVMAENYFQHAEHYFRIISAAQAQNQQRQQDNQSDNGDQDDGGSDDQSNDNGNGRRAAANGADNEDRGEAGGDDRESGRGRRRRQRDTAEDGQGDASGKDASGKEVSGKPASEKADAGKADAGKDVSGKDVSGKQAADSGVSGEANGQAGDDAVEAEAPKRRARRPRRTATSDQGDLAGAPQPSIEPLGAGKDDEPAAAE
ncbi:DUF4167 domain-containing protein [Cucumibacter marinus]|uniref:DUF4167 domain-containing protein n=1 Tax=Cucumibacter marinus TaxID=1121252 RepID=UPI0003F86121|nr:DUF4167 domain-containing protein [Cucumibacter marinus]